MISALLRRDSSVRFFGRWLLVAPVTSLTFLGILASSRVSRGLLMQELAFSDVFVTVLALWAPTAIHFGVSAMDRRVSHFDVVLPISSRRLWLAHTLALGLTTLAVLGVTGAIAGLLGSFAGSRFGLVPETFALNVIRLTLAVAATFVLGVSIVQSVAPSIAKLPRLKGFVLLVLGMIIGSLVLSTALGMLPVAFVPVPLLLAFLVGRRTYERLPGMLTLAPLEPTSSHERARVAGGVGLGVARERRGFSWLLFTTIYRSLTKMPVAPLLGFPLLVFFGIVLSGLKRAWFGGEGIRFMFLILTSYMLLAFTALPPRKLYMLDAFPVSRKAIFAIATIPLLLAIAVGYGAGRIVADAKEAQREVIELVELDCCYGVRVPIEVCEIAWDGAPPQVTSPWGERHEGWETPLWKGGHRVLYSPFSAPQGSSPDFIALQISRAAETVYGRRIPYEEIRDRYLEVGEDGIARPKGDGLTLARDYPDLEPQPRGSVFPFVFAVASVIWMIALTFYLRTLRAAVSEKIRRGVYWGTMMGLLALHMVQYALSVTGKVQVWVGEGFWEIVVRNVTERVPGGEVTIWVLNTLIVVGVYLIAQAQFERVESSPGDERCAELVPLLAWGRGGTEGAWERQ